ncbi:Lipid A biosynthesis myristoyltransferase [Vibrio stylophorae]|uniref:Lipid A biosynthesis acyltransferase n=1 Tax=Vibrio stylophorae TaxID=659351 RepID=A0ABM8ZWE0_9VIBR|nr:lauroyl-Kdo(2)-lipid IV(A) myristoyltransferase [Vibrio stylophorae]CAH0534666.1 Lipid A biosynthesis myristoyltransferase [Vibrio stylophorae]
MLLPFSMHSNPDSKLFNPTFEWRFLQPKFWGVWLAIPLGVLISLTPLAFRRWLAGKIANRLVNLNNLAKRRAMVNIELCFPEKTEAQRKELLRQSYHVACAMALSFCALWIRSRKHLDRITHIEGEQHLMPLLERGEKIILLVPHTWPIDIPAIYFASKGYPMLAMIRPQKNPMADWLMHRQRMQYGGRIFPRDAGIKPFIRSIKEGYMAYYLPDEDHGPAQSEFVPFFATEKATLKGFGKLARLSGATVVPLMPGYDLQSGQFTMRIDPPFTDFPTGDEHNDAQRMAKQIETFISDAPEQYMWILNILRSAPDGSIRY